MVWVIPESTDLPDIFKKYRNIQLLWRIKCRSTSNEDLTVIFQIFSMNLL